MAVRPKALGSSIAAKPRRLGLKKLSDPDVMGLAGVPDPSSLGLGGDVIPKFPQRFGSGKTARPKRRRFSKGVKLKFLGSVRGCHTQET